jgi:hypothetical protein
LISIVARAGRQTEAQPQAPNPQSTADKGSPKFEENWLLLPTAFHGVQRMSTREGKERVILAPLCGDGVDVSAEWRGTDG